MFNILKYKIKLPSLFTFLAKLGMEFPNDPRPACFVAELYSIRSIDLNSNSCGLQLTMYTGSKQRAQRMGRLILTSYYKTKTIHPLAPHLFQLKTPCIYQINTLLLECIHYPLWYDNRNHDWEHMGQCTCEFEQDHNQGYYGLYHISLSSSPNWMGPCI